MIFTRAQLEQVRDFWAKELDEFEDMISESSKELFRTLGDPKQLRALADWAERRAELDAALELEENFTISVYLESALVQALSEIARDEAEAQ